MKIDVKPTHVCDGHRHTTSWWVAGVWCLHSLNSGTRIRQKCAKERTFFVAAGQGKTHLAICLYGVVCLRARVCVCAVCMAHCLPQQFDCFIFAEPLFNRKYNNTCTRTWAMEEPPLSSRSIRDVCFNREFLFAQFARGQLYGTVSETPHRLSPLLFASDFLLPTRRHRFAARAECIHERVRARPPMFTSCFYPLADFSFSIARQSE